MKPPGLRCEPIGTVMDWSYDSPVNRISQDERTSTLEYGQFDNVAPFISIGPGTRTTSSRASRVIRALSNV